MNYWERIYTSGRESEDGWSINTKPIKRLQDPVKTKVCMRKKMLPMFILWFVYEKLHSNNVNIKHFSQNCDVIKIMIVIMLFI